MPGIKDIPKRTPMIRVELQLDPPVPTRYVPYWWGYHNLKFHPPGRPEQAIWQGEFEWLRRFDAGRSVTVRVEKTREFGWILVAEIWHEKAKEILSVVGIPERATGERVSRPRGVQGKAVPDA